MYYFGSGTLWATPLLNAQGASIANPTPLLCGVLQDVELDIKFELKTLHGQNQFPVAVGRGKGSVEGKAKFAEMYGAFWNTVVFGQGQSNGLTAAMYDTTGQVIPASPFQVTVAPPSSGTFDADLGVVDAISGRPLMRVASAPTTGQYSVAAGVYTFASADAGKAVYINYRYTATSTVAQKGSVNNVPMGYSPTFRVDMYNQYNGEGLMLTLPNCQSDGVKIGFKNDDFGIPEFGFQAFADAGGNVFKWSMAE